MTAMTVASALVEARPADTEVAIVYVPAGSTVQVHHPDGVRWYEPLLPDEACYAVVPGDKDKIGWGAVPCWYGSLTGIRNGRHRMDREAWHAAARALAATGVVYVQYKQREYYGAQRWTAVACRVEVPA
ncbi:hypothetical protein [Streptosporangium sp. NPDC051022]|uniref:hypothetical protein n=1 Tax=Streptosporangium sp. NPDC051022 TaxID=3155752 RepID=UPI00342E0378